MTSRNPDFFCQMLQLRDTILIFSSVAIVLSVVLLAAGIPISSFHLPAAVIIAIVIVSCWNRQGGISGIIFLFFNIYLASLLSAWISQFFIDIFWDSRWYHGPAIIALADGWNPLYQPNLCNWNAEYCNFNSLEYINHYPKSNWYISGVIYAFSGDIDYGKIMNLLLLISVFISTFELCQKLFNSRTIYSVVFSVAVSANPIALAQATSGYVDGLLASLFTLYFVLIVNYILYDNKKNIYLAILIIPYLVNIKFTGLVYVIVLTIGMLTISLYRHRSKFIPLLKYTTISGLASVLLLGFNPYIFNVIHESNPFYPAFKVAEEGDILRDQVDFSIEDKSRISKFLIANYSVAKSILDFKEPQLSVPLFSYNDIYSVDTRFSAFGPNFSLILGICVLQLIFLRNTFWYLTALIVIVTAFISPAVWWARLAPQVWLAACLIQIPYLCHSRVDWRQALGLVMCMLLIISALIPARTVISDQFRYANAYHSDTTFYKQFDMIPVLLLDNSWYWGDESANFSFYNKRKVEDEFKNKVISANSGQNCPAISLNRIFQVCD